MEIKEKRDILAKQNHLKNLIRNDERYGLASVFAVAHGLDYSALCATLSGRQPNRRCVITLMKVFELNPEDFPRLPSNLNLSELEKDVRSGTNS